MSAHLGFSATRTIFLVAFFMLGAYNHSTMVYILITQLLELIDFNGDISWSYPFASDSITQHHDLYAMDDSTYCITYNRKK